MRFHFLPSFALNCDLHYDDDYYDDNDYCHHYHYDDDYDHKDDYDHEIGGEIGDDNN